MPIPELNAIDAWPIAAVAILNVLDMLSGYLKGYASNNVQSRKLWNGLIHKSAYWLMIVLFAVVQGMQSHFAIWEGFPTVTALCVLICVTEIISITENAIELNPELGKWDVIKKIIGEKESIDNER